MGWKLAIGLLIIGMVTFAEETKPLKTLEKGTFSGIDRPLQVVVTNQVQWAELWEKHTAQKLPKPPPPEINFSKESVLFVTIGRKNSGGYSVEITDMRHSTDGTEVIVATTEPKPGNLSIQALTSPFHIVVVPRIESPVKFTADKKKGG